MEWVHAGVRLWSVCVGVRDKALFPKLFGLPEHDLRD